MTGLTNKILKNAIECRHCGTVIESKFRCSRCGKEFWFSDNRARHERKGNCGYRKPSAQDLDDRDPDELDAWAREIADE